MAIINKTALYFKQVASVIGDEAAEIELQKVIDSGIGFYGDRDVDHLSLVFIFSDSPQGGGFWRDIEDKSKSLGYV